MSGQEEPEEYLDLARIILYARERAWAPAEYLGESAVFIQAFQLFHTYTLRLVNEIHAKARAEEEVNRGGRISNP